MWRLGTTRSRGVRRGSRVAALLLIAPALIWSCGGSSERNISHSSAGGSGKAGSNSSPTAGKPSETEGGSAAGTQASANGGTAAGSGGEATAGAPITLAGAGGTESAAGAGGVAQDWDPELLGFACDSARCSVGQACIRCVVGDAGSRRCVPNPAADPTGFAAATAECTKPPVTIFDECDGPEDCPGSQYCVAAELANGFMRCRNEPSSVNGSCCFACGAATDCTLCRSSADCPDNVACEPAQFAPAGIMGCKRRP